MLSAVMDIYASTPDRADASGGAAAQSSAFTENEGEVVGRHGDPLR